MNEIALSLTPDRAGALLPGRAREVQVEFLRPANHTWRVEADGEAFFVKVHTKPWYGGKPSGDVVRHEVSAHRMLAGHGLPTPEIVSFSLTCENPVGWPYLLTRELEGTALTELLPRLEPAAAWEALRQVGVYLARMHAITFDHPGYLNDGPPSGPPEPERWQHPIWRFERFLRQAFSIWTDDATTVDGATMDALAVLLAGQMGKLRAEFHPPRFTHGDCHASQFFLAPAGSAGGGRRVTGVLDLEVASSGAPLFDFLKLAIELSGHLGARPLRWWEPLFEAYGRPVDFDLLRLALAAARHINYTCLGRHAWPGSRAQILRHLIRARTWSELFDLDRITEAA